MAHDEPISAVEWLQEIGVIPAGVEFKRRNAIPKTVDASAIPAGYLAEVALSWDDDGKTSPEAFLYALEPELRGSVKQQNVSETLESLGKEANS